MPNPDDSGNDVFQASGRIRLELLTQGSTAALQEAVEADERNGNKTGGPTAIEKSCCQRLNKQERDQTAEDADGNQQRHYGQIALARFGV